MLMKVTPGAEAVGPGRASAAKVLFERTRVNYGN